MKKDFKYIFVILGLIILSSFTKDGGSIVNNISSAINKGDVEVLSSYFNSTIDLVLPDNNGVYSKAQADIIMRNFFKQYPPQSFKIVHQGVSGEGAQYAIGDYMSSKIKFRVYFLIKKVNSVYLIKQLRFEEE